MLKDNNQKYNCLKIKLSTLPTKGNYQVVDKRDFKQWGEKHNVEYEKHNAYSLLH